MVAGRRDLKRWFKQTINELNGVGGIASLGGVAISAGSLTVMAGTAAAIFASGGAAIFIGSVGYAIYKATPEPAKSASELVGKL